MGDTNTNQRSVIAKSISHGHHLVEGLSSPPPASFAIISTGQQPASPEYCKTVQYCGPYSPSKHDVTYVTSTECADMSPTTSIELDPLYHQHHYDPMHGKRKSTPVPYEHKDDAYWERRKRNNESAKRSREIRRIRELQTTKRIVYLEQENVKLSAEVKFLREELKRLRETEFLPFLLRNSIK